jgi:hypothetical protein
MLIGNQQLAFFFVFSMGAMFEDPFTYPFTLACQPSINKAATAACMCMRGG